MKNTTLLMMSVVVSILLASVPLFSGCMSTGKVASIPSTATLLFSSNQDTQSRRSEIYAFDIENGTATRITYSFVHHFITGISPSRRYLVTSVAEKDTNTPKGLGDEDRRSIWIIDLEANKQKRFTDPSDSAEADSFSPDSDWVVFLMKKAGDTYSDIYKVRRDGSNMTQLTHTSDAIEGDPTWTPDGRIIFNYFNVSLGRFILKIMDADGGHVETIYDSNGGVSTPVFPPGSYDPSVSPDGKWIVFEQCVHYNESHPENWGSGVWHIFRINSNGTGLVDLSQVAGHNKSADYLPSFSSDGQWIAFGSLYEAEHPQESYSAIFIMEANGGSLRQLTSHAANAMYPAWIPSSN